jgi:transposase-like protein
MEDYPKTLLDFEQRFNSETACREYLESLRWPTGFVCPHCGSRRPWRTVRGLHKCRQCRREVSATAGTLFQDTHRPLQIWFRAMWYVTNQKHGVSALGLQRVLGLGSYRTAWTWLHKLRCAMVRPGRDRLSGTVETDETYIGGPQPGKRGRGAAGKSLVVVMVQDRPEGIGRIRLTCVDDASAKSLTAALQQAVQPGSTVRTDDWTGYADVAGAGYTHQVVRPTADVGDNLLPLANRVTALLKRWLLGTHQGAVRPSHLDYYLDEFTFRFNRRTSRSRGKLFYRLVQQAAAVPPVTGQSLHGGRHTE